MLVSSILNFATARFNPGNDLPYLLFLPTYTAAAWFHGRLAPDLQADLAGALRAAEAFALGAYASALMQGDALPAAERAAILQQLARFTGLTPDYLDRADLRVEIFRFTKELLRDRRRTIGRLDARFQGIDRDAAGEHFEEDPSLTALLGAYTAAFNDYVRGDLKFETDLLYEVLHPNLWNTWSYAQHENQYVNVAETLRRAMTANPHLKVLVASGYYDLATPYFATEYTLNHLGLDASLRANFAHTQVFRNAALERLLPDWRPTTDRRAHIQATIEWMDRNGKADDSDADTLEDRIIAALREVPARVAAG